MKLPFSYGLTNCAWTHGAYCCAVIAQIPLQWSCLLIDLICTARSFHKVQYDVWQVWASESETNISLYFWLNKVPPKENCIPPMCTEAKKNDLVSFGSVLLDYVMGLVVKSCSRCNGTTLEMYVCSFKNEKLQVQRQLSCWHPVYVLLCCDWYCSKYKDFYKVVLMCEEVVQTIKRK